MGLTARGVWKTFFCWRTSPLPSPLFPPEPTSSPGRSPPGWGVQIFPFPLIFHLFFPGVMPRGGSARWQRSRGVIGATPGGEGAPRARRNAPAAAGRAGAGSAPTCARLFPYLHGNPQIRGDPSCPEAVGGAGCFPDTPKSPSASVRAHLKASPPASPHAKRGSRRGESANMNSYCGKTCCTLIIFSVVSRLFGL